MSVVAILYLAFSYCSLCLVYSASDFLFYCLVLLFVLSSNDPLEYPLIVCSLSHARTVVLVFPFLVSFTLSALLGDVLLSCILNSLSAVCNLSSFLSPRLANAVHSHRCIDAFWMFVRSVDDSNYCIWPRRLLYLQLGQ